MGTSNILGGWRIIEMELLDGETVDLMGAALIEFGQDQTGRFRFVAVEGWMDCRHEQREGRPHVEFSWEGHDDSDQAHGRGWATLANDGSLQGRIYFHMGDDSSFRAVRAVHRSTSNAGTARGATGRRR
jgi:PAS domain-containing protein